MTRICVELPLRLESVANLRESGEIEQKGDVIVFLHREDYYDPAKLAGVVELIPAKGRNLPQHSTIYLHNRFDRMRLEDWQGPLPVAHEAEDDGATRGLQRRYGRGRAWT